MIESIFNGLFLVLQWPAPAYLMIGLFMGLAFGAIPGLGGLTGFVLLLPFTFGLSPVAAMAMLLGLYAVTTTSDTLSSVLLGIPGSVASQATILDGYPLTKKGQAARALGAAFTVSAIGGIIGGLFLALSVPILKPLILSFGSAEMFMLGILGLTMVGSLSGRSIIKGLAAAGIGLLLSQVGYAGTSGIPRYWLEMDFLLEGIPLIPVVLGLFALPELADLANRRGTIARTTDEKDRASLLDGVKDAFKHRWLTLRSSVLGVNIGMLPGLGAPVVDWIAYGHAIQSSKDKSEFGKGDIRGVIAPEAASNSMKGGSLIPTLAFGIPGDAAMAILLGAMLIHGMNPGPSMLTTNLDLLMSMVWVLIIANVLGSMLLMMWSKQAVKLAFIPGHYIVPGVLLFLMMGTWLSVNNIHGWILLIVFGIIGTIMKRAGWPRPALVLGFVLGPIMEQRYLLTEQVYGSVAWLGRPIVLILIALTVLLLWQALRGLRNATYSVEGNSTEVEERSAARLYSLLISVTALVLGVAAAIHALDWPYRTRAFPLLISAPLIIFSSISLVKELRYFLKRDRSVPMFPKESVREDVVPVVLVASTSAIVLSSYLFGKMASIIGFVLIYLLFWARYGLIRSILYASVATAVMYFLYDYILRIGWLKPVFSW